MTRYFSEETNFFAGTSPEALIRKYGSPLYIYNENILRERCREMKSFIPYPGIGVNYSVKANSNIELLRIIRDEGLNADAMSPGEIYILLQAGFRPENLFYVGNNVSAEEMSYAVEQGVTVSVDSVSQLEAYGKVNPGGRVAVRFNPGIGAGHHEKVVTAGRKTKFGVNLDHIGEVGRILKKYSLQLIGINQHIGSLFMEGEPYLEGVKSLLNVAEKFENLEFADLGGGFGIPYRKQEGEKRLALSVLGEKLGALLAEWCAGYGSNIRFKVEPGRYITAECGILLGTVHAVKTNYNVKYIGTDIGFNVLPRPVLYDAYHEIEVYRDGRVAADKDSGSERVTIVGNICESGDILVRDRNLPRICEGDILGVMDAGAYGYSMCSNYNNRLRPAEVLITGDGRDILIRRRDTLEDLVRNYTA